MNFPRDYVLDKGRLGNRMILVISITRRNEKHIEGATWNNKPIDFIERTSSTRIIMLEIGCRPIFWWWIMDFLGTM